MVKIGIVGFGFVGGAVAHGFAQSAELFIYDKYDDSYNTLKEVVDNSDFIFICVPTPMKEDGSQDLSYLDDAIRSISWLSKGRKIVIIKSTVLPKTTRKYSEEFVNLDFVFNPEFLTERTAKLDFINPSRIVLGGDESIVDKVEEFYRTRFPVAPIYKTSFEGAELVKYMNNAFFALKISFLNEVFDIADYLDVDFESLRNMWLADYRIANSHTDVPGHDGKRGYGGKCFPKDVNAIIKWAEKNGLNFDTAVAADKVNERVRDEKDWFDIKGATVRKKYGSIG